jgi:hypothetical protein
VRRTALLLLAAVVAMSLGAGCADRVAPAARVGDAVVTTDELLDEVSEWAGNDQTARATELAASHSEWGYAMAPVVSILHERIILDIAAAAFDDLDLELTDASRDEALGVLIGDPAQAETAFAGFSEEYADRYVDDFAKGVAVQEELGEEEFRAMILEGARDVEVSPRFGTWDAANASIIPPVGPRPAPGTEVLTDPSTGL